ncbi:MAG: hypothetical protein J4G05_07315 [Chlorobi bacterium]|nr:hypothetical protein [Chlorobiota bacterium]
MWEKQYQTLFGWIPGFLSFLLIACGRVAEPPMQAGGLYVVEDGRGGFRPAKMIRFDSAVVHLRLYSNRLAFRPDTIVSDTLHWRVKSGELPSYEHFPMSRQLFASWSPELRGFDSVTIDEIRMVEEWKTSGGEIVGGG